MNGQENQNLAIFARQFENAPFNGLADYPFKAELECGVAYATITTYDKAICTVWARVEWNSLSWVDKIVFWSPVSPREQRLEAVQKVINAYVNLQQKDSSMPVYHSWLAKNGDKAIWNMIKKVAQISTYKDNQVRIILDHLAWATDDGTIPTNEIINPRNAKANVEMRDTPPDADSYKNWDITNALGWGFNNIGWVLGGAVVLGGLFYFGPALRNVSKKLTD